MNYEDLSREQLVNLLVKRDTRRKLGLIWERDEIGHDLALNEDFVVMDLVPETSEGGSYGEPLYRNLIIEGENFDTLRWLRMTYSGRVKAIYTDPPYNTGKKDFTYNDTYVSREDRFRHSKWIEKAYQRLMLAKDLLRDDGVIFLSIGDDEVNHLGLLMDQVFGARNRLGTIVWKNATDNNPSRVVVEHEYILVYAANIDSQPPAWKVAQSEVRDVILARAEELKAEYPALEERIAAYKAWHRDNKPELWPFQEYDDLDDVGPYTGSRSVHNPGKEGYRYDILHPDTKLPCKQPRMGYRFPKETMDELLAKGRIIFGDDHHKIVELKLYAKDYKSKLPSVIDLDGRRGANELKAIFPEAVKVFSNPKPSDLIADLLAFVTAGDDIVLDFYAGSGSTAHAVAKLNAQDNGRRRFILTNEAIAKPDDSSLNVCRQICAERVRRVLPRVPGHNTGTFAYLTTGRLDFEDITYDLSPERTWLIIQAMHDVPLRPLTAGRPVQHAVTDDDVLVAYVDKLTEGSLATVRQLIENRLSFVYSWTPDPIRSAFGDHNSLEIRMVPDAFIQRFRS